MGGRFVRSLNLEPIMPDQTPKPTTELDTEQAAAELNISVRRVRQ